MAIYGLSNGLALMAYPAAVVVLLCFGLVAFSLFSFIVDKVKAR